ncbi:hypothetical protein GGQ99_000954 [Aminobacter niigataensis]|uniref:Phage tail lysozyme domain-containing protein n=1 Tax=Aminobacter niigataensis TaxID=83265 RepID=A0ABR6KXI9_9HYPH|nr:phage tail tip lysozyme [Aminobacter niigataensis]MBB4649232.1 hypothetical protein [Aminobacter niigataensis]
MSKGKAQNTFRAKAPGIMAKLMADFPLQLDDVAAILGNFGHECYGFTKLQEISPTVKGSRGGYGWAMWTGPRRRAYEAYCARNKLDPASDEANYAYVFVELKGPERHAIPALRGAIGLAAKVKAFEVAFERAGAKHYVSRNQWASLALEAWYEAKSKPAGAQEAPSPAPVPVDPVKTAPATPQAPKTHQPSIAIPGKYEDAPKNGTAGKVLAAIVVLALAAVAGALGLSK